MAFTYSTPFREDACERMLDLDLGKADQALEHSRRIGLEVIRELAQGRHRGTLAAPSQ